MGITVYIPSNSVWSKCIVFIHYVLWTVWVITCWTNKHFTTITLEDLSLTIFVTHSFSSTWNQKPWIGLYMVHIMRHLAEAYSFSSMCQTGLQRVCTGESRLQPGNTVLAECHCMSKLLHLLSSAIFNHTFYAVLYNAPPWSIQGNKKICKMSKKTHQEREYADRRSTYSVIYNTLLTFLFRALFLIHLTNFRECELSAFTTLQHQLWI